MSKKTQQIQKLFEESLGASVKIIEIPRTETNKLFEKIITRLDAANDVEVDTFNLSGIDISLMTSPMWETVELLLDELYGTEVKGIIFWYLIERFDSQDDLKPYLFKGVNVYFNNLDDLWNIIYPLLIKNKNEN